MKKVSLALVAALCLFLVPPPPAVAQADSTAVALNTRDGASIFRLAFSVRRVMSDVVDQSNAAVAVASCEHCQTVAVAIQVVLVFSDPDVVSPTNLALALNVECSSCETLASAYQYVFTTGGVVHFTAEGSRRLAEIRNAVRELLASGGSIEEIQAELDVLMDELADVLATELSEPVASPDSGEDATVVPTETTPGAETAQPEGSPTPEETPTVEESTSASPEATSSP